MSLPAIRVEELGKLYRLGATRKRTETFQEALKDMLLAPLRRVRQMGGEVSEQEEFWALKDVSFEVQPGEVVGIVGRNGAGKSTLLKVLSRIVEPTCGQAILRGRVSALLEVGTGFHPELTGRENIYLNGSILGMKRSEIDASFDEIVAFSEISKFLDTPVKRYSSGMYVRLAFAVAAHLEPDILIVDEVLAVGDMHFQKKCLGKMQDVVKKGRTVLFVSHQVAAVSQLCSQVMWLDKGGVVEIGPTSVVLPKYIEQGSSHAPVLEFEPSAADTGLNFRRVSVIDASGNPSTELDARADFSLRLECRVTKPLTGTEIAVRVRTSDGVAVFTSLLSHHRDSGPRNLQPGEFHATLRIPGNYLMPGHYMVSAYAYRDSGSFEPLCIKDDLLHIHMCEAGTRMAKYSDPKSIGVVLVDFPWEAGVPQRDASEAMQ